MSKNDNKTPKIHIVDDRVRISNGQIPPVVDKLPPPPNND